MIAVLEDHLHLLNPGGRLVLKVDIIKTDKEEFSTIFYFKRMRVLGHDQVHFTRTIRQFVLVNTLYSSAFYYINDLEKIMLMRCYRAFGTFPVFYLKRFV